MTKNEGWSMDRRTFLRLGGRGALGALAVGYAGTRVLGGAEPAEAAPPPKSNDIRLMATDGYFSFPGREFDSQEGGIYGFGFRPVGNKKETYASADTLVAKYKGSVTWPAPILDIPRDADTYLVLTNLGFVTRPDLDDSHTIHWHGFRNPNSVFDGVPEVSIAVPLGRNFPYFYRPRDEGTYMYHCHFEDTEHVQMGMDGVVFVESSDPHYAYNAPNGAVAASTRFDRQFTFMLNEIFTPAHDNLRDVQENVWSDYTADRWLLNGRSYPDTVIRDQDLPGSVFDLGAFDSHFKGLYSQPVSSLMQINAGETGLIRIASLGYEQHNMSLDGIEMTVVGQDSSYLGGNAYKTRSLYLGAGEARDVVFLAPAFRAADAVTDPKDPNGAFNRYWFRNMSQQRLINPGVDGPGGMLTELRVYPAGTLGTQSAPNATF